jgi:hypothetical protein
MSKKANTWSSDAMKLVHQERLLMMILGGVGLVRIRWSKFSSREMFAEAKTRANALRSAHMK